MDTGTLYVVMPIYEDAEASSRLFRELASLHDATRRLHVVAVDDGSVRQPVETSMIVTAGLDGTVLRLRRNVGHQRAIAIGISHVASRAAESDRLVVMDSDGEDTPQSIPELLTRLESDTVDIVAAVRRSRVETLRFRMFYQVYKALFSLLSGRRIDFGNFMAMKPMAARRIAAMPESWTHVAASTLSSKLRIKRQPLDRGPRYAGRSKMNFVGLALHGFRALMVFGEDVLVRVGIACSLVAFLSISGGVAALILKTIGFATPGWFSLAMGILLLVFLQTAALTLMVLMMSGIVRGGDIVPEGHYLQYIDEVLDAHRE
ncbi:dolichol-phosphate mannosyltransferase [Lysobacter oculi]|uniref:Dolichol-phosphate mannosyltransferase n=1 Tax=Solilutibacter oculi TaxID=2698682 RepID=A0A344J6R6_9GAMM|nr:glycosyltransferase [Lysobacter oculi]AXA84726.1 dolichol-phosphate mannosyltransferase [Lysobacter oculi]